MPQSQIISEAAKSYDSRRFQTTVPYYRRHRLAHPDLLFRRVIERVGLRPRRRNDGSRLRPQLAELSPKGRIKEIAEMTAIIIATRGEPA